MFHLILCLLKLLLCPIASSKRQLLLTIALQKKEIEILKRTFSQRRKRISFSASCKRFFALLLGLFPKLKSTVQIVTPETVLKWYRLLLKSFWTFPSASKKAGRPATPSDVKNLILRMKNENILWGIKRIQGELLKLDISLDKKTISSILKDFRRKGKIKSSLTWKKFIKAHLESLFACDFFTVDTLFGKRFYVFFILYLATRKIVHLSWSQFPNREFVRQGIISFSDSLNEKAFLIHDRSPQLFQNYPAYNITGIATSVEAPNMNAYAERFVRSIRRESLDHFIIFSEKQMKHILVRYIDYYNPLRPHQGIGQRAPCGYVPQTEGTVVSTPILSGLHHHYSRTAA